jgi:hypothetical protein
MPNENNKPIISVRDGVLEVAIFAKTFLDANNNQRVSYSFNLQKSYKDQNAAWQRQNINLFDDQALKITALVGAAYGKLVDYKKGVGAAVSAESASPALAETADTLDDDIPF